MKKTVLVLTFFSLLITTLSSCKKDNSASGGGNNTSGGSGSSNSSVSLLTSSRWTFQKREYQENGSWVADPNPTEAIAFNIGFNTDGTSSEFDTATVGVNPGTWAFSSNNTVLTTTGGIALFPAVYTVETLSSSALVLTTTINSTTITGERFTLGH
jgi:hypothetical protein